MRLRLESLVCMDRLLLLPGLSILSWHHVVEVDGSLSWSPLDVAVSVDSSSRELSVYRCVLHLAYKVKP